jgi:hypothetical protein
MTTGGRACHRACIYLLANTAAPAQSAPIPNATTRSMRNTLPRHGQSRALPECGLAAVTAAGKRWDPGDLQGPQALLAQLMARPCAAPPPTIVAAAMPDQCARWHPLSRQCGVWRHEGRCVWLLCQQLLTPATQNVPGVQSEWSRRNVHDGEMPGCASQPLITATAILAPAASGLSGGISGCQACGVRTAAATGG